MEKLLKKVNTLALLGILAVLIMILIRLPQVQRFPTLNELRAAQEEQRQALMLNMPVAQVYDVIREIDVNVTNDVDVNVTNTPLEVHDYGY